MTTCYLLGKSRAYQLVTALYALAGKRPAHGNHPALFSLHQSPLPRLLQSRVRGFAAWSPSAVRLPPIRVTITFAVLPVLSSLFEHRPWENSSKP